MKKFIVKQMDAELGARNLSVDADGYVVGGDGSIHFIHEKHLGRPPEPFLVIASGFWSMCAVMPEEPLDTRGTIIDIEPEAPSASSN
jgi:hypothetical protein